MKEFYEIKFIEPFRGIDTGNNGTGLFDKFLEAAMIGKVDSDELML